MFNQQDLQGPHGGRGAGASSSSTPPAPQPLVSPRISFSNDFSLDASGRPSVRYERRSPAASPPSDFEFSVGSHSMMAADELFSRGRLRPLREHYCAAAPQSTQRTTTTLRDELLAGDVERGLTFSPPSSSPSGLMAKVPLKWKTLMGLRKANSEDKKHDKETK
ncbi:hypothetical protein Taro_017389 [Colocasia esculenta]|uniref:Uncharacterized protein n=1 Tax=Colocasia esculenta TaxID=4460 RepID=A0A843UNI2_COLES|nr:hypothetical protein [Colocasia esculenta]